jgi:CubicO group peptidase (beta-lactamase class C family)
VDTFFQATNRLAAHRLARRWLWRAICLCLGLALPAGTGAADPAVPSALPRVDPAELGFDTVLLDRIAPQMQRFVDRGEVSGVVSLVARRGKIAHFSALGLADVESGRPMQPDTIFAIASMTKPITATAVMMLQDEGKLSIDDPVAKYLPEFADVKLRDGTAPQRAITLRHLLTHTSGLGGSQQNEGTLAETAAALARRPLDFEPGTRWQYGPGLSVCGRVVEVVSGMPLERFLSERLFEPLGMRDTTFLPNDAQRGRLARLYQPGPQGKSLQRADHWLLDLSPDRSPNPSGGLFSTADDMARFYQMILDGGRWQGKQILSEKAVRLMTTIHTGDLPTGFTPGNGWGLGWCVVADPQGTTRALSPGSYGHGGAFGTQGWVDPQREMVFVLLIQRTGFGNSDGSDIRATLQQLAVDALRSR